jgi:hypothetical protein
MSSIIFSYLLPIIVIGIACLLCISQGIKNAILGNVELRLFCFSILGFSYFGLTVGFFVGLSSSSVVSTVLPALLTFIGGIMTYYFFNTTNQNNDNQILTMFALISISIFLSLGAYQGIEQRKVYETNQKANEIDKETILKQIDNELKKDILQFEYDLKQKQKDTINFDDLPKLK